MSSTVLQSRIHLSEPAAASDGPLPITYVIYFITGNPGLIEYYRIFLTHLYGLLLQSTLEIRANFHVFGRSLSGFEVDDEANKEHAPENTPPFGLLDQIDHSENAVEQLVRDLLERSQTGDIRVILVGHSVGAYILLELVRRLREKTGKAPDDGVRVVGGICLFPTVTHIAQSASGRRSSWLLGLRPFAQVASLFAKALTSFFPSPLLTLIIRTAMSFPADATKVTAAFVKSRHGVRQALHMARDEMAQITSDAWDAEIWGAAHPSPHPHPRPTLRFLFAKEDHWVADETRDDLIRARGSHANSAYDGDEGDEEEWKPVMEIDEEEGWPHGFCIKHSVPVAERVHRYVLDIVAKDNGRI